MNTRTGVNENAAPKKKPRSNLGPFPVGRGEISRGHCLSGILIDFVLRGAAEELVDLALDLLTLVGVDPLFPEIISLPDADDQVILGFIGTMERLSRDVTRLL